jgi:hypothetical protein
MSSKAFTIRVFTWLHQVNHDLELLAVDVCVALQLVIHFNEDDSDGRAWPSCKTLGEAIGLSEATVIHSVRRLHARGHLRVIWGQQGRSHPNQYWMEIKPCPAKVSDEIKPQPAKVLDEIKPESGELKPEPAKENHYKNHQARKSEPDGERPAASGGGPAAPAPPSAGRKKRGCPSEEKDYGALRAVWPRPWEDDDAADRRAFTAALQVASASVIIAGAKERVKAVAERNKDKGPDWVSFLPTLAKYLKGRGWENPLPKSSRGSARHNGSGQRSSGRDNDDVWRRAAGGHIEPDDEGAETLS